MKKIAATIFVVLLLVGCGKEEPDATSGSKWIARVLEYRPAPGQFINASLGNAEAAARIVGKPTGIVSLGGFGGYIVFAFDHKVANRDGCDFVILGNAFANSSEPGIVSVSVDANGDGLPNDPWYELRGSAHDGATANYTVTYRKPAQTQTAEAIRWTDNLGGEGALAVVPGHAQSYWPWWADGDEISFAGTLLADNATQTGDTWTLEAYEYGYADNYSDDYAAAVAGDNDTVMSNKFDISDATGPASTLESIDFIRVATALNNQYGLLGECSTEVGGAISLTK